MNPANGEIEDTDVGFPGPEHTIAERAWPMKIAMGTLAVLAVIGGVVGIPGLTDTLEHFLEPTFEDSRYADVHPSAGSEWAGLAVGAIIAVAGIMIAARIYLGRPGAADAIRRRFAGVHRVLVNKYYVDELYDAVFVRPLATAGTLGRTVIETDFVQAFIVGGATGIVRVGTSFARGIQTGVLRVYALLLVLGLAALTLYFLIQSS
jgi:NADH-quinone oxidoreductase subunit L